jgi:TolB protein
MPERPLALSYFDAETFRRRAEQLEDTAEAEQGDPEQPDGIVRKKDLTRFLENVTGVKRTQQSIETAFPGRLALLRPRSEQVEVLPAARPGADPRAFSPDGSRLLFTQLDGEYRQLFELDVGSGNVRQVTRWPGVHPDGCYGPDGRLVWTHADVVKGEPVAHIEITEPGGRAPQSISKGPLDFEPACAPDGSAVVWTTYDDRGHEVLAVRQPPVEGEVRIIGPGRSPAFSPDSRWIVYSGPVARAWRLYRVRPDGSGRARIGDGTLDELEPAVSPDGRLVVYVSDDGYHKRIYVKRLDGSGDRVLLDTGGGESPVW